MAGPDLYSPSPSGLSFFDIVCLSLFVFSLRSTRNYREQKSCIEPLSPECLNKSSRDKQSLKKFSSLSCEAICRTIRRSSRVRVQRQKDLNLCAKTSVNIYSHLHRLRASQKVQGNSYQWHSTGLALFHEQIFVPDMCMNTYFVSELFYFIKAIRWKNKLSRRCVQVVFLLKFLVSRQRVWTPRQHSLIWVGQLKGSIRHQFDFLDFRQNKNKNKSKEKKVTPP